MIRAIPVFIVLTLVFGYKLKSPESPVAFVNVADTIPMPVFSMKDSLGLPYKYKANIVTPVCESDKCYIIEIDFYWDLIGRFVGYDTIPGMGLTKLDHIPFTHEDYEKLDEILGTRNSVLANYTKEELVENTRESEVDGFTGATAQEIKESVISGGVYSCFTLWHIAHGAVEDSIQKATKSMFSEELIKKLVNQGDQQIDYYLINNFSESDFQNYLPELLATIPESEGYYAKNTIEKMPENVLADSLAQDFFSAHFASFNYYTQAALLKKLKPGSLSPALAVALKENMDDRDSYKNELIKKLLYSKPERTEAN